MIKNSIYLTLTLFIIQTSVWAQPILTKANNGYEIGSQVTYSVVTSYTGNEGPSGANQVWDFSNLGEDYSDISSYINPSSTPYSSDFPNANVAETRSSSDNIVYYKVTDDDIQLHGTMGTVSGMNVKYSYSIPEKMIFYPITYGDSQTQNWNATVEYQGQPYTSNRTGSTEISADGYGTLKLPSGTYNNVIRILVSQEYTDEVIYQGTPIQVIDYFVDTYYWYQATSKERLMAYSYINVIGSGTQTNIEYNKNPTTTSIELNNSTLNATIFPNPTSDKLNIHVENQKVQSIELINTLGVVITNELPTPSTDNNYVIDVRDYEKGIYWLRVQTEGENFTQKIIIN
ncbi:MAG: T9SS type A sorting domain-containing protein [Brumimicrobium sp.]|nr:T9SS type A sorting domain-containing protein [Brumimicrobium sp.]